MTAHKIGGSTTWYPILLHEKGQFTHCKINAKCYHFIQQKNLSFSHEYILWGNWPKTSLLMYTLFLKDLWMKSTMFYMYYKKNFDYYYQTYFLNCTPSSCNPRDLSAHLSTERSLWLINLAKFYWHLAIYGCLYWFVSDMKHVKWWTNLVPFL